MVEKQWQKRKQSIWWQWPGSKLQKGSEGSIQFKGPIWLRMPYARLTGELVALHCLWQSQDASCFILHQKRNMVILLTWTQCARVSLSQPSVPARPISDIDDIRSPILCLPNSFNKMKALLRSFFLFRNVSPSLRNLVMDSAKIKLCGVLAVDKCLVFCGYRYGLDRIVHCWGGKCLNFGLAEPVASQWQINDID